MSANLFGDRYFGRKPAWHNMGVVMDRPMTASEAVKTARLDYRVYTTTPYIKVPSPLGTAFPMVEEPMADTLAIYREPTPDDPYTRTFGTASKRFTIVQNTDLARILDPMTEHWPVETAGALKQGEIVWFLLDMGETTIAGEPFRRFAWTRNSHTPGYGLTFKPVRTRVVCANTDLIAQNEAGVTVSLRHTADVAERFEYIVRAMDQLRAQNAVDEAALERLAEYAISTEEVEEVVAKAYPLPEVPKVPKFTTLNGVPTAQQAAMKRAMEERYEKKLHQYENDLKRMEKFRTDFKETHEKLCDEFPRIGGTAYSAYQAFIEVEQYRRDTAALAASAFTGAGYEIQRTVKKELLNLAR